MTPKQENFVNQYLIDFNATQAAIRSGYSKRTAEKIGSENLRKPAIRDAIKAARDESMSKDIATREEILGGLTRAIRFDPALLYDDTGNLLPVKDLPESVRLEICGLKANENIMETSDGAKTLAVRTTEYKFPDKKSNRELLGKYHSLFEKDETPSDTKVTLSLSPELEEIIKVYVGKK